MAIGVINIMKKVFVKPEMEVLEIERISICEDSGYTGGYVPDSEVGEA